MRQDIWRQQNREGQGQKVALLRSRSGSTTGSIEQFAQWRDGGPPMETRVEENVQTSRAGLRGDREPAHRAAGEACRNSSTRAPSASSRSGGVQSDGIPQRRPLRPARLAGRPRLQQLRRPHRSRRDAARRASRARRRHHAVRHRRHATATAAARRRSPGRDSSATGARTSCSPPSSAWPMDDAGDAEGRRRAATSCRRSRRA